MRLINADSVGFTDFEIIMCDGDYKKAFKLLCEKLDSAPTVEAEPIVRCKDCRFYDPLDANRPYDCLYMDSIFGDDYCSRGEKI